MMRTLTHLALALWLSLISAPDVAAQTAGDTAGDAAGAVDAGEIEALVETLEDEDQRADFIAQLKALIAADEAIGDEPSPVESVGAEIVTALSGGVERVGEQIGEAVDTLARAPGAVRELTEQAGEPDTLMRWIAMFGKLVLVLALGMASRALARRLLKRSRERLADRDDEGLIAAVILFGARAVLIIVPVAVFGAVAWLVMLASQPDPVTRVIGLSLINASILIQGVLVVARLAVEPAHGRSLVGASGESAAYVLIWLKRLLSIAIYGYFFAEAALLLGLSAGAHAVLLKVIGLVIAVFLIILTLQNRHRVAQALREAADGDRSSLSSRLAEVWHLPALLYVIIAYGTWALQRGDGFAFLARATVATAVLAVGALLVLKGLGLLLGRGLHLSDDLRKTYPGLESRTNRYFGVVRKIVRFVVLAAAAVILIEIWIGGSIDWLTGDSGRALVGRLVTITLIIVGAVMLWELVTGVVERMLAEADRGGGSRSARLRTLLPLIRNAARVVLGVIVVLTVLSEIGINIAPLLAGAGIAGVAVGFGAQSLVKDVITGIFILLEDSVAVGDVVNVGGHSGVVESMSVRTVRLRDLNGNVHTVPFGEIATVLNMTKEFAYAVIEAGVAYKENVDDVVVVLQEVGDGMREDADYGASILEPLDVLGLDSFGDSAVNIRVRLKTLPGKQWGVRREFHRRMKAAFDAQGIEIPFPHRTVVFGTEDDVQKISPPATRSPARARPDAEDSGADF